MNAGAGLIATGPSGVAIASAMSMMDDSEEDSKKRRKAQTGRDQVVYETKKSKQDIGKDIAEIYDDWYYNDKTGAIYQKPTGRFNWLGALVAITVILCAILLWAIVTDSKTCTYEFWEEKCTTKWPLDLDVTIVILTMGSLIAGFFIPKDEKEIKYIRLSDINKDGKKTRVLIKVYDDSGYREIDDDKLLDIEDKM